MSAASEIVQLICADEDALMELAKAVRAYEVTLSPVVLLETASAAAYLGLSVDALDRRARASVIPCIQEGPRCKRFFNRDDLDAWRRT